MSGVHALLMASDAALTDTAADARPTTGWISLCAGAAWSSAVETLRLVVLSSTEAEYCGGANACKEVVDSEAIFYSIPIGISGAVPSFVR